MIRRALIGMEYEIANDRLGDEQDFAFHQAIAKASGNALFYNIIRSFEALMKVAVPTAWETRATAAQRQFVLDNHRNIALAIVNRIERQLPACAPAAVANL